MWKAELVQYDDKDGTVSKVETKFTNDRAVEQGGEYILERIVRDLYKSMMGLK